ncbi:hypothetical protein [Actinoallomurus sp. CA-150999]|uniref:hypothetical protein n=1 Tax=Actinoallomurus sp. CA-150999 TaxID=3239887 RepID=UPI003D8B3C7C
MLGKHGEARRRLLIGVAIALPLAAAAGGAAPAFGSSHQASPSARMASSAVSANAKAPVGKNSYYINTLSTKTAYARGLAAGKNDAKTGTGRIAILDFGGQLSTGKGTLIIGRRTHASNAQIAAVAEQFAAGYSKGVGSNKPRLTLGVGTNNSVSVTRSLGVTWAKTVATAASWATKHAPHTTIVGANDLEPGFGGASAAVAWAKGYSSVKGSGYLNFGSADGCPQASASGGACDHGWTQETLWYLSTGVRGASVTPEIYYPANAKQWALISKYGKNRHKKPLSIPGAMDQYPGGGNTAAQAWSQLRAQLKANGLSTTLNYGLEIRAE